MKQLLVAIIMAIFSLGAIAQENKQDLKAPESKKCIDYIKMSDSGMMINKDCQQTPLTKDFTFTNGVIVSATGLVKMLDGTKMQLIKGDAIDMNGKLMKRNKIKGTF